MGLRNTFSTTLSDIDRNNTVYVESLNAFPTPVGNVITLQDQKKYILTKPINSGLNQVQIPDGGDVQIISLFEPANNWTTDLTGGDALFIGDLARLQIQDIDFICSTGAGNLFDINITIAPRAVVVHQRSFVSGFASLGTINGATSINNNVVYNNNGAGITITDSGTALGAGVVWDTVNFISQTGDHLTINGSADFVSLNTIVAAPSTGDMVVDLDSLNATSVDIGTILFDGSNGGTTGLEKTYTSNQTLNNIFTNISVDTTGGAVQIEMPDSSTFNIPDGFTIDITDTGNAGANFITIVPNSSDSSTINSGLTQYRITEDSGRIVLSYVNNSWEIINRRNQNSISTVSTTSTLAEIDDIVQGDTSGGLFSTTLPTAQGRKGKQTTLKKIEGNAATWTILPDGSETIDNNSQIILVGNKGPSITIESINTGWIIV